MEVKLGVEPVNQSVRVEPTETGSGARLRGGFADQSLCNASVRRLLESRTFARSPRLLAFLRYICERSLEGNLDELTEQQVGMQVFSRPANYNPGDDNIVRATARQLRQRLALYYQEEGKNETLRVEIPRGAYAAVFREADTSTLLSEPVSALPDEGPSTTQDLEQSTKDRSAVWSGRWSERLLMIALGAGLAALAWLALRTVHSKPTASNPFWAQIFSPDHQTLLVPGDAGLNLYDNLAKTQVSIEDYISGAYLKRPEAQAPKDVSWDPVASRRYTSIIDLRFADRLHQVSGFNQGRYEIRFARDLQMTDLRGDKNVILLGAPPYNPWVQLFDDKLNFRMQYNGVSNTITVINKNPVDHESVLYQWSADDPSHRGYATIALIPNLDRHGSVLLIQGTTMAGMDGAMNFLMSDDQFVSHLPRTSGHSVAPFEMLLETRMVVANSPEFHLIATRTY